MSFEGTDITIEDGCVSEKILVISSDRRRFERWRREHDIHADCANVIRITNPVDLKKYANVWYADLGLDPEYHRQMELYEILADRTRTGGFREIPR